MIFDTMTATTEQKAQMPLERAFEHVCTWINKRGPNAHKNIMAHLRAVTGRSIPLPTYHNKADITEDVKREQYRLILKALVDNNYGLLQGQGQQQAPVQINNPDQPAPKPVAKKKPVKQEPIPELPPETITMNTDQPIQPIEQAIRAIVREELLVLAINTDFDAKIQTIARDTVKHALSNGEFPADRVRAIVTETLAGIFARPPAPPPETK